MKPLPIVAATLTTALGAGNAAHAAALREGRSGLAPCTFSDATVAAHVGEVRGLDNVPLPEALADHDCRNNRLAWHALQQDDFLAAVAAARARHGAHRVAVLLGTSTSGIFDTELAYRRRGADGSLPADFRYHGSHNSHSVASFVSRALGLTGPCAVVSTACSSSAKVFASAARLIDAGWADAAVVGGVDSLCLTTLHGFNSLELVSADICRPWDADRRGLSLGDGAAYALIEREVPVGQAAMGWLLGTGESSDGHHMSSPHPEGVGAVAAMRQALTSARLQPGDIDYVNLHGTATPSNDAAEDHAVSTVFGTATPCSSTKGATGHTLGAAGGVEAVLCLLAMQHGVVPGGLNVQRLDPALRVRYEREPRPATLARAVSNSFGFGDSNACLVFGAAA